MLGGFALQALITQLFCHHHIGAIEIDHFLRVACCRDWAAGGILRCRPILESPADQIDKADTALILRSSSS